MKKRMYFLVGCFLASVFLGFLAFEYGLWMIGLAFVLIFLAISFSYPLEAFYFLVAYLPWQIALNLAQGFDVLSGRILIVLFFISWLVRLFLKKEKINKKILLPSGVLAVFLLLAVLSLSVAVQPVWGLRKFLVFISSWPLFFVAAHLIDSETKLKRFIKTISFSSGFMALVALGQFIAQFLWGIEKIKIFFHTITQSNP